jgi:hypothetical protein
MHDRSDPVDVIELLTQQHRDLEQRMQQLGEAASDDTRLLALLRDVGDHLSVHIASEEEIFYPAVRAASTEGILLESLEEHLSLKRLLADLLELSPAAATFEPKFRVLREQSEHHHKEEEENLFPTVCRLVDVSARAELGAQMLKLQQRLQRLGAPREAVTDQTGEAAPLR